jgi:hypothetical protein
MRPLATYYNPYTGTFAQQQMICEEFQIGKRWRNYAIKKKHT